MANLLEHQIVSLAVLNAKGITTFRLEGNRDFNQSNVKSKMTVSCTYAIRRVELPYFFDKGRKDAFWRIAYYSNTKLALLLCT